VKLQGEKQERGQEMRNGLAPVSTAKANWPGRIPSGKFPGLWGDVRKESKRNGVSSGDTDNLGCISPAGGKRGRIQKEGKGVKHFGKIE